MQFGTHHSSYITISGGQFGVLYRVHVVVDEQLRQPPGQPQNPVSNNYKVVVALEKHV